MLKEQTGYWQQFRDTQVSRRRALAGIGAFIAGIAAFATVGCDDDSSRAAKAPTPPRGELVVIDQSSPHIRVFDTDTHQVLRQADFPDHLRCAWSDDNNCFDGKNLWVGAMNSRHGPPDFEGNEVLLVDLDTLAITKRIPLGKEGTMFNANTGYSNAQLTLGKSTRDGRVFVTKMLSGEIVSVDGKSQAVVTTRKLSEGEEWLADNDVGVSADGIERLFLVTNNTGRVLSADPVSLTVRATYQAPEGVRPYRITVAPDGDHLWVQNTFAPGFAGERIGLSVLDARSLTVVKHVKTGTPVPSMATFSPDGRMAYMAYGNGGSYVSVIDTSRMEELRRVEVGANASNVAVHPDGKSIYVRVSAPTDAAIEIRQRGNFLVRVDTTTWQVGERFGAGNFVSPPGLYMRSVA